jgi:hypothetical protein
MAIPCLGSAMEKDAAQMTAIVNVASLNGRMAVNNPLLIRCLFRT